jgi:hypothetical protein
MTNLLSDALDTLALGQSQVVGNLTMFAILGSRDAATYLTLDESIEQGLVEITETSEGGSVPEIRLVNRAARDVLLLDGEELVGARQNRVLNLTILVGPATSTVIPVSCVERGRWSYRSRHFSSGGRTLHARARAQKAACVSESLAVRQGASSDQGALWQEIARKSAALGSRSSTEALADVYAANASTLEAYRRGLHWVSGQIGAAFVLAGRFVGVELFDAESTCRKLLPRLVDSYAMDAIEQGESGRPNARLDLDPTHVLGELRSAPIETYKAIGKGEDVRIRSPRIHGAALTDAGRLVHLTAFASE